MAKLKNNRQEKFAQAMFKGSSATAAAKAAGYSEKWAGTNADKLLKNTNIQARIQELFQKAEDKSIMSKRELAQMYTRMLHTKQSDFLTMGADGICYHEIGPETTNQEALKKVKTRVVTVETGSGDAVVLTRRQFDEVELEPKKGVGEALSKLMGYDAIEQVNHSVNLHFDQQDEKLL